MNKFLSFLGLAKRAGSVLEGYSKCDEQRNKKKIHLFIPIILLPIVIFVALSLLF